MHAGEAHLQTLSLDQNASFDQIREAYQDLVMVWHPDRFLHNPRLYRKAEAKLKEFNQAYAYLKAHQPRPAQAAPDRSSTAPSSPPAKPRVPKRRRACPWLTFSDAAYILNHYSFQPVAPKTAGHQTYHSGPFVLDTCDQPAEVTLSVPCDSVHGFDRILLSIPCKSKGHFCQAEAEQLLQLLQNQRV
ncbi:J domain-containing protein [Acaryochloris sp. IP29b_bin.137]|uniref:J domain-containing protein n=1 Tax=Acaryochloris sp. IP29b_bin.137 TaxID=2969217 RepID=UPI00260A2FF8|nr:J domain-containing protein [Acaryochloris sp. IP29b_bin.137]